MTLFGPRYPYNLGYALSGGGAKGFAHLGALKMLDESGLKPDVIVGTSAGSLAGVLYADGYTPDEICELFKGKEFRQFIEFTKPTAGFFKTTGLQSFLKNNLRAKSFEELKIPFIAVATDWNRARAVTFSQGDFLIDAVVASCSIPIVFYPQLIDGVPYVDGGLLKNFPVSVIRKKCKYVVGVNVSLIIPPPEKINLKNMIERTFNLMANSNTLRDRKLCDILIETEGIEKFSMFDLNHSNDMMELGARCASQKIMDKEGQEIVKRCLSMKKKKHAKK
ncbi:patatin-like phospholipase family protein [Anaerorudis cellulosivorans]|uniref:patatin-like phospholipase family protein n=1 Tax=Anaerorudis cellulosivorans TaxID=3397862 RepID=UPI00221EF9BD|nr:patatin-like phospholipase family protein [Seramator thermalis]MCW1734895.1 patatin-like phospholipase family protein [Seramator thermalis]